MKKLFLIGALCGATRALAAPAVDPFADCEKYVRQMAKGTLKAKNQVALRNAMARLKVRKEELEKKLVLGLLSNREQLELAKILTYDINL